MIVPDANLLLYAHITVFPEHARARKWWEATINGEEPIGLTAPALFAFLRVGTNGRLFATPMSVSEAVGLAEGWLVEPNVSYVVPGSRHLEIAFTLLHSLGTGGNLTTDVQLAAHAIEHGAELHSNDNDFARFDGLRWRNPLR